MLGAELEPWKPRCDWCFLGMEAGLNSVTSGSLRGFRETEQGVLRNEGTCLVREGLC